MILNLNQGGAGWYPLLRWAWQRLSDWCTTLDVLEWIGWKTKLVAMLAGVATGVATFGMVLLEY